MSAEQGLARALVIVLPLAVLAGCQSAPMVAVKESFKDSYQEIVYKTRKKGESNSAAPDYVRREFGCNDKRPFDLRLESTQLLPTRLKSGREVSHRIVYAACTPRDAALPYPLVRRVILDGRILFEDRDAKFEVKAGRWTVDSFVGIPAAATPGTYTMEVFFDIRGPASRKLQQTFEITS